MKMKRSLYWILINVIGLFVVGGFIFMIVAFHYAHLCIGDQTVYCCNDWICDKESERTASSLYGPDAAYLNVCLDPKQTNDCVCAISNESAPENQKNCLVKQCEYINDNNMFTANGTMKLQPCDTTNYPK